MLLNLIDLSQCKPTATLYCDPASKPWPRYRALAYVDSAGNSSYQALLARFEHRVTSGLNLHFEYTLAKTLTDTFQSGQTIYNQISDCRRCSKGPATFDVRNRAVSSLVWETPFGRGRRFGRGLPRLGEHPKPASDHLKTGQANGSGH